MVIQSLFGAARRAAGTLTALALLGSAPLTGQEPAAVAPPAPRSPLPALRLADALRRADAAAYGNRIAAGQRQARDGQAAQPLRGILPSVRVEGGWMRTTDPVAVFGTSLRQRTVTPADFDPARLNYPDPRSDVTTGLVAEVPLFNADAWTGRKAAGRAAGSAEAQQRWTRESVRLDVVRAYFGAILAAEKAATLDTAVQAARRHVRRADAMAREGMVTRSDALLASVRAGELEADLAAARAEAAQARRGLAVLIGDPADTLLALPARLPDAERVRTLAAEPVAGGVDDRADVQAARLGAAAAEADSRRATSLYLPRINAFGRYDWHDPTTPFGGEAMWTVGVMASWSPFAGASEIAERRQARGRAAEAGAMAEAAEAQARLDLQRRESDLAVALARLGIAETAVAQSAEADRIVTRKYEGGLASVVELLDAAAMDTATQLRFAFARYETIVALAARRLALGGSLGTLERLDVQ
jgi:outer membrane protein TolC